MKNVQIYDAPPGAGKTTRAIEMIEQSHVLDNFIFITPFLPECERIIDSVKSRHFIQPSNKSEGGKKLNHLKRLLEEGKDIVATHRLFEMIDDEVIEILEANNYRLILDEVMTIIDRAPISKLDMDMLMKQGHLRIASENGQIEWLTEEYVVDGRFYDIKLMAQAGTLYYHRGKFLVYAFPPRVFQTFKDVTVLTYLFRGQFMRYYFDLYKIPYELNSVRNGSVVPYDVQSEGRERLMALINVYEGKHNEFADGATALSTSWLGRRTPKELTSIKKTITNYVRTEIGAESKDIIWTCKKNYRDKLKGPGYSRGYIPLNERATNKWGDRHTLAYITNRYMNPPDRAFFEDNGISVNQDIWALSEMLQWIFRGAIRNGEQINLFLPSSRMRGLLKAWAKYEI